MAVDEGASVLLPGQGKTVLFSGTFSGNGLTFVYAESESAYSLLEWDAAPGAPGTPLHLHRVTDEAFYVLEDTFGFLGRSPDSGANRGSVHVCAQGA